MDNFNIIGEFINQLQFILNTRAPELDINTVSEIKTDANEELHKILVKYNLIKE